MTISNDLYNLIKSLTRQEKIYFKRFSGLHMLGEGNNYVLLFDAIDVMKSYDESQLLKKFASEKFTRQISVAKNYLYHAILKSLKTMRKSDSKKEEISNLFEDVRILFEKGLYSQCRKILRKCKKLAEHYEKYPELIEILIWDSRLNYTEGKRNKNELTLLNENYDARKRYLRILENMYEYDRLEYNFKAVVRETRSKDKSYKKRLKTFIDGPLMSKESLALSTVAKLKYNAVKSSYYYETGNHKTSLDCEVKQVKILDDNPGIKSERFTDYLVLLSNILLLCVIIKKNEEFKKYLAKLRSQMNTKEVSKNNSFRAYIVERSYLMEMFYHNKRKEYDRSVKIFGDLHKEVDMLGITIRDSEEINLKYLLCAALFELKNFEQCLDVLNEILNEPEAEARVTEYLTARMFNLILHYELGNLDLLEYAADSTKKFIKERKRLSPFEKLFFKTMNSLAKIKPGQKESEIFDEFKYQLSKMDENECTFGFFERIDLIGWIRSKL